MTRRSVLGAGLVLVLGAGTACSASGDEPEPPDGTIARTPPPAPPGPSGEPLLGGGPVVDVRTLGAVGDGRTDDTDAVRRGLEQVNAGGGTLYLPAGAYRYRGGILRPAAGVTLAGDPGASTILYDDPAVTDFAYLFSIEAAGVTVDGLVLRRSAAFRAVLLDVGPVAGLRLSRTVLDGGVGDFPDVECHGVKLPDRGTAQDIVIADSTMRDLTYGLFQTNGSTAVITGITVERSAFTRNHNSDLEFNSPNGTTRRVRVTGCTFSANDSEGFGVGLAHVADAVVSGCTFDTYRLEAVHVEDYCDGVSVEDNRFTACGLRGLAHVQVIAGCSDVRVVGNDFDATANTQEIFVVNALPGGTGTTPGGRPPGGPSDVLVRDNTFTCSDVVVPVYFQDVSGGVITANTITSGTVRTPEDAFRLLEDPGTATDGNTINGRTY